jgi:hypothetical protein
MFAKSKLIALRFMFTLQNNYEVIHDFQILKIDLPLKFLQ